MTELHRGASLQSNRQVFFNLSPPIMNDSDDNYLPKQKKRWKFRVPWNKKKEYSDDSSEEERPEFSRSEFDISHVGSSSQKAERPHTWYGRSDEESVSISDIHQDPGGDTDSVSLSSLSSVASNSKKPKKFKLKMPSLSPRESSANVKKTDRLHDKIVQGRHSYLRNDSIHLTEGYGSDESSLYHTRKKYRSSDESIARGSKPKPRPSAIDNLNSKQSSSIQDIHEHSSPPLFTRASTVANLVEESSGREFASGRSSTHSSKSKKSDKIKKMEATTKSESNLHGNVVAIRNPHVTPKKDKTSDKKGGRFLTFFKQITYQHSSSGSDYSSSDYESPPPRSKESEEKKQRDQVIQELKDTKFRRRSRSLSELNSKNKNKVKPPEKTTKNGNETVQMPAIVPDAPNVGEWQHRKTNSLPGRSKKKKKNKQEAIIQHTVVAEHHEIPRETSKISQPMPKESKVEYPARISPIPATGSPAIVLPDVPKAEPDRDVTEKKRRKKKTKTKANRTESESRRIRRPSYESMVDLLEREEFDPTSDTTLVSLHSEKSKKPSNKEADSGNSLPPGVVTEKTHLKSVISWQKEIQRSLQDLGEENPPKRHASTSSDTNSVPEVVLSSLDLHGINRPKTRANASVSPNSPLYSDALDLGFLKKRQKMPSETTDEYPTEFLVDRYRNSLAFIGEEPPPDFPPPPPPVEDSDGHSTITDQSREPPVNLNYSLTDETLYENCRRSVEEGSSLSQQPHRDNLYLPPKSRKILKFSGSDPPPVPSLPKIDDEPWSISSSFAYDSSVPPSPFSGKRNSESVCTCSGYPTSSEGPSMRSSMRSTLSRNLSKQSTVESIPSDFIDEALDLLDQNHSEEVSSAKRKQEKKSKNYFDRLSMVNVNKTKKELNHPKLQAISKAEVTPPVTLEQEYPGKSHKLLNKTESTDEYTHQIRKSFAQFADRYIPVLNRPIPVSSYQNQPSNQTPSTYNVYKTKFDGDYSNRYRNDADTSPVPVSTANEHKMQAKPVDAASGRVHSVAKFSTIPLYNSVYKDTYKTNSGVAAMTNLWEKKAIPPENFTKNTRIGELPKPYRGRDHQSSVGSIRSTEFQGAPYYKAEKVIIKGYGEPENPVKETVDFKSLPGKMNNSSLDNTVKKEQIEAVPVTSSLKSPPDKTNDTHFLKRVKTTTEEGSEVTTTSRPVIWSQGKPPTRPLDQFSRQEYNRMAAVPNSLKKLYNDNNSHEAITAKPYIPESPTRKHTADTVQSPVRKSSYIESPTSTSSQKSFSVNTGSKEERKSYPDVQLNINHTYFNSPEDHQTETRIYRTTTEKEMFTDVHTTIMIPGEREIITVTTSPKGGHPIVRKESSFDLDPAETRQLEFPPDEVDRRTTVSRSPPPVPEKPPPKRPLSGDQIEFMETLLTEKPFWDALPPRPPTSFSNLSPRNFQVKTSSLPKS